MNASHFDRIARALVGAASRRAALVALLGGVALAFADGDALARGRRDKPRRRHGDDAGGKNDQGRAHGRRASVQAQKKKPASCPRGRKRCGKTCIDTASDVKNCGRCGAKCVAGQSCRAGKCTCNGQQCAGCCEGTTCQTGDSQTQCGADGAACAACPEGQVCCDGACRNLGTDVNHCGTCGNACPSQTANECVEGACKCSGDTACPEGWRCCANGRGGAGCYLLTHNVSSCGACDNRCDERTANRCTGGVCTCNGDVCTGDETCCNGVCRDTFDDPFNCGACNSRCPGLVWATADEWSNSTVGCPDETCTFGCRGQNYDLDGDPSNGCEAEDGQTNHTQATAQNLGSFSSCDSSRGSFSGTIYSDAREHTNPEAAGFTASTGAAPLWFRALHSGGLLCENDPAVDLAMSGGTSGCYKLTLITNLGSHEKAVTNGSASIALPNGSYSSNTSVFFKVEKTCGTNIREAARFTASFHL